MTESATETYSFGVRVPLRVGQPEEFDVVQYTMVDFWPETIQSNITVSGLIEIYDVQVENVSVLMSDDGVFDLCPIDAAELCDARTIRGPECRHGVRVRGRYFGSRAIPGTEDGQVFWSFFLSFKGPAKQLELRGPHFTAEEKARKGK